MKVILNQFIKYILLAIFTSIMCITTTFAEEVNEFIQRQATIRVYIDDAGLGSGNETKTYNLMLRLWQLGFNGKLMVVYRYNGTKPNFAKLFNIPDDNFTNYPQPASYDYNYRGSHKSLLLVPLKTYYNDLIANHVEPVNLAIAGYEKPLPPCNIVKFEKIDAGESTNDISGDSSICNNLANFANAKVFLRFNVGTPGEVSAAVSLSKINAADEIVVDNSQHQFFVAPNYTVTDAEDYLQNDANGKKILQQKPVLKSLIDAMKSDQPAINILPVYGWTLGTAFEDQYNYFPWNILQIIAGARYAQLHKDSNTMVAASLQRPLVIVVFYDFMEKARKLDPIINKNNWSDYETYYQSQNFSPLPGLSDAKNQRMVLLKQAENAVNKAMQSLSLSGNFIVADSQDANAVKMIQSLKPNQILLLSMGPLPKIVFDGLYASASNNVWPQIREGVSSFDTLSTTGKPHFRCGPSWELGFDSMSPLLKQTLQRFYGDVPKEVVTDAGITAWGYKHSHFCEGIKTWLQYDTVYQDLGDLFVASQLANSDLSMYFLQLKYTALKRQNDRILSALSAAAAILDKQ